MINAATRWPCGPARWRPSRPSPRTRTRTRAWPRCTSWRTTPVPYLRGAALLGAAAGDCLVVEDAPTGVRSGLRAGMTVWTVNSPTPTEGAHRHFPTLREAAPEILAFAAGRA